MLDQDNFKACSRRSKAAQLARRMIAAGVSLYDPDPLRALAAAARKRKRKS
jgi:hypothetical protein